MKQEKVWVRLVGKRLTQTLTLVVRNVYLVRELCVQELCVCVLLFICLCLLPPPFIFTERKILKLLLEGMCHLQHPHVCRASVEAVWVN